MQINPVQSQHPDTKKSCAHCPTDFKRAVSKSQVKSLPACELKHLGLHTIWNLQPYQHVQWRICRICICLRIAHPFLTIQGKNHKSEFDALNMHIPILCLESLGICRYYFQIYTYTKCTHFQIGLFYASGRAWIITNSSFCFMTFHLFSLAENPSSLKFRSYTHNDVQQVGCFSQRCFKIKKTQLI